MVKGNGFDWMKLSGKPLTVFLIVLFCALIMLPPIIHGYIYPTLGDDTADPHLATFDRILENVRTGEPVGEVHYLAYPIVGYPMAYISEAFGVSIDDQFLWFNYIALVLVGLSCYFVVSRLVNRVAGLFALFLPVFCAQGLMFLFHCGTIFNIINIGVILPWVVYFAVKWLKDRRVYQLIFALVFAVLFSTFHTSGVYLVAAVVLALVVFVVYRIKKQKGVGLLKVVFFGLGMAAVCSLCIWFLTPWGVRTIIESPSAVMVVPAGLFFRHIVSLSVWAILAVSLALIYGHRTGKVRAETKMLVFALLCLVIPLIPTTFINELALDVCRQAFALATIVAVMAAVFAGLVYEFGKSKLVILLLVLFAVAGSFNNVINWFDYNSAIRQVDKDAIAYVNTLDCETYSCNVGVAPWVFGRFVDLEYTETDGDVLVERNMAMTPQCNKDDYWFKPHGIEPNEDYRLLETFDNDKDGIVVSVYEKIK